MKRLIQLFSLSLLAISGLSFRSTLTIHRKQYHSHVAAFAMNSNHEGLLTLSNSLFDKIKSKIELKETDFTAVKEMNSFQSKDLSGHDYSGSAAWHDETKGSKLTGISRYCVSSSNGDESKYGIDGWLGPGLPVPHLILAFGKHKDNNQYWIETDYIPRGSFPFGSDPSYLEQFYKYEMSNVVPVYRSTCKPAVPKLNFYQRLIQSPVYFSATDVSQAVIEELATTHLDRWLNWLQDAKPLEARQKAGFNSRDDKLRQFAFQANLFEYSTKFGSRVGKSMAIAFTGPVAEAYVGGGS